MDRCIALSLCLSVLPCFSFVLFFFFLVVVLNQTKSNAPALRFPKQVFSLGYFWLPLKALLELEYWFGSHLENKQYIQCVFRERKTQVLITVYPTPSPCPPPLFFIISFNQINALTPPPCPLHDIFSSEMKFSLTQGGWGVEVEERGAASLMADGLSGLGQRGL